MNISSGKFSNFAFAAIIITVLGLTDIANAAGAENDTAIVECNKVTRSNLKKLHKILTSCYTELKVALGEIHSEARPWCAVKCVMQKDGLVNEQGLADDALIKKGITGRVQPDKESRLLEMLLDCNKQLGSKLDPKDPFCKTYGVFGTCIHHAIADVCGTYYELP